MCPGSFHVRCDAGLRVPWLLAVAAVFGNCSRMTALTRCARIMHHRPLATAAQRRCASGTCSGKEGGTHGPTVAHATGGRGQMPVG